MSDNHELAQQWIDNVRSKAEGRTRYEGQEPYLDEAVVAYIDDLLQIAQNILDDGVREVHRRRRAEAALRDLWRYTVWGAAKGAVYEDHKQAFTDAGVELDKPLPDTLPVEPDDIQAVANILHWHRTGERPADPNVHDIEIADEIVDRLNEMRVVEKAIADRDAAKAKPDTDT